MITFTPQSIGTLDPKTGQLSGVPQAMKPQEPTIGTMAIPDFHKQVIALAQDKVPIEKVDSAIMSHPEIQDKAKAKSMASAIYTILGNGKEHKKML